MNTGVFTRGLIGLLAGFGMTVSAQVPDGLTGREAFIHQQWPAPRRTLVWANPGQGGNARNEANWVDQATGQPAGRRVAGRHEEWPGLDVDLILPDSPDGRPYFVGDVGPERREPIVARHIHVGKNARLDMGVVHRDGDPADAPSGRALNPGMECPIRISGNLTVDAGGHAYGVLELVGSAHTFVRIHPDSPEKSMHAIIMRKEGDASATLLSDHLTVNAGIEVHSGRLVVGPDMTLRANAGFEERQRLGRVRRLDGREIGQDYIFIHKDGVLELSSGATIGMARMEADLMVPDIRLEGLLTVGNPQNPIRRDVRIELSSGEGESAFLRHPGGFYLRRTGDLHLFSADPARALLVFTTIPGSRPAQGSARGAAVYFQRPVRLDGVRFEGLRAGGLSGREMAAMRAGWGHVEFGAGNAGPETDLLRELQGPGAPVPTGRGVVTLVDGPRVACEVVMRIGDRLVILAPRNQTVQSLPWEQVHLVETAAGRLEANPRRPLTAAETAQREKGPFWGSEAGPGQLGRYVHQDWERTRLLVWAQPGVSGSGDIPSNWLEEDGLPAFDLMDANTDVLLPAADTEYQVVGTWRAGQTRYIRDVRHLTVEANGQYSVDYHVYGNVWVRHGARLWRVNNGRFYAEGKHTFARFEDPANATVAISHIVDVRLGADASVELIGRCGSVADRVYLISGTLILSENSSLGSAGRATFFVDREATLVMLNGSSFMGSKDRQVEGRADLAVRGHVMVGHPERPITRDLYWDLIGYPDERINPTANAADRSSGASVMLNPEGRISIHSADPRSARLVIRQRREIPASLPANYVEPQGLVLALRGRTDFNGIVFDNIKRGGIHLADMAARERWQNVSFGPNNHAPAAELFTPIR